MPRPKKYADAAEKMRSYRRRKRIRELDPKESAFLKAQQVHDTIRLYADRGEPMAARLVGYGPFETALNLLAHLDVYSLKYAYDREVLPARNEYLFEVKSD